MMLILAEKPNVANKIANSLGTPSQKKRGRVSYYTLEDKGIIVASAVGHLYSLRQTRPIYDYPFFEYAWVPVYTYDKNSSYVKQYETTLKSLAKKCDTFVNACDYDTEGSVIGHNALRFACEADLQKTKRMKFSTLTAQDLQKAFEDLEPPNISMIESGLTRHELDWIWGMNTSKALSSSIEHAIGRFIMLSAGRVQTPTLSFLVRREKEIDAFIPEVYYEVFILFEKEGIPVKALYPKRLEKDEAEGIKKDCEGKDGIVAAIKKRKRSIGPPIPMDLGILQSECYKNFRFTPKKTQKIAQSLYESGLISYPRTSSQKLPPSIDFRGILSRLNNAYPLAGEILKKKKLSPVQGKKKDPAHPAIHPTGELKKITKTEKRVYDLIVHRFISHFSEKAVKESIKAEIKVDSHIFLARGARTVKEGWLRYYGRYTKSKDTVLPDLSKNEEISIDETVVEEKETKPPPRYNPASVIKEMENLGIGTKATRAAILDILYRRNYIKGRQIEVTELGKQIIDTLERYCRDIISVELTSHFEEEMEKVYEGKFERKMVIEETKKKLTKIFEDFREKEEEVGREIAEAFRKTERNNSIIGKCPKCGGDLRVVRSKKTGKRFVGCSNYPTCTNSFPLPQRGEITPTKKVCECGYPIVRIGRWRFCVNTACPKKKKD
jgi:DNA topoisomerase-1